MIKAPKPHFLQPVTEQSHPGEARRWALRLAVGLDEEDAGRVALVVTELAHNLIKHAGGGELLLRPLFAPDRAGFEILALDKGPGMDSHVTMQDGFSTSGTPGNGLGTVLRQSDEFELFSAPKQGAVILARIWQDRKLPAHKTPFDFGAVCVPVKGERDCGDLWQVAEFGGRLLATVVDGLGHGIDAAEAAEEAVRIFDSNLSHTPCAILERTHDALRKTRGAAMSIAEYNFEKPCVRFAGIGNVGAAMISSERQQSMVSHNGTLGAQIRRCQEFEYSLPASSTLVMHSDGLLSSWDLKPYKGVSRKDPVITAALLYRDFSRGRDDATVLVVRERVA